MRVGPLNSSVYYSVTASGQYVNTEKGFFHNQLTLWYPQKQSVCKKIDSLIKYIIKTVSCLKALLLEVKHTHKLTI